MGDKQEKRKIKKAALSEAEEQPFFISVIVTEQLI